MPVVYSNRTVSPLGKSDTKNVFNQAEDPKGGRKKFRVQRIINFCLPPNTVRMLKSSIIR